MNDAEQRELIGPVSIGLAVTGFMGYLVYYAFSIEAGEHRLDTSNFTSGRNELIAQGIHSLAEMLGLVGSIVFSVVMVGAVGGWIAWTVRRIRRARLKPAR